MATSWKSDACGCLLPPCQRSKIQPMGNIMINPIKKSIIIMAAMAWSSVASAALTGVDLLSSGDQLLTRDTSTGLDWLDLTATINVAPEDILNGSGGWRGMGFRYATISEVSQLFLDTAPGTFINNVYPNALYTVTPINLAGAQNLLNLMGTVYVQQPGNDYNIVGNGLVGVNAPGQDWIYGASYGTNISGTGGFFFVPDGQFSIDTSSPYLGSYLVRSSGAVSPVSEPETYALMLAGLGVVGGMTRRRKRPQADQIYF